MGTFFVYLINCLRDSLYNSSVESEFSKSEEERRREIKKYLDLDIQVPISLQLLDVCDYMKMTKGKEIEHNPVVKEAYILEKILIFLSFLMAFGTFISFLWFLNEWSVMDNLRNLEIFTLMGKIFIFLIFSIVVSFGVQFFLLFLNSLVEKRINYQLSKKGIKSIYICTSGGIF